MKLIVPIQSIIANSNIESNAQPDKVRSAAMDAQRIDVQLVLGQSLLSHFVDHVNDDGVMSGLTVIQEQFYSEFLTPMFAKFTEAHYAYSVHYHIDNVGVNTISSERSTAASDKAVETVSQRAKNAAEYLATRAKAFILDDANKADLGDLYRACHQDPQPQNRVYQSFIYTPYRK
jgi:hypothetical protein